MGNPDLQPPCGGEIPGSEGVRVEGERVEGVWTAEDEKWLDNSTRVSYDLRERKQNVLESIAGDLENVVNKHAKHYEMSIGELASFIFDHRAEFRDILNRDQT